jgi:RNA polymerase sigma-70 factor (ECF subfamily)
MPSDRPFDEVLSAAKQGDEWAWEHIYRSISGRLVGYLTFRGAPDPEDQASETLLQVARNISSFDGDEKSFRSWVFVIAHRRLIDSRRSAGRRPDTTNLDIDHPVPTGDVEEEALDRIAVVEIAHLLQRLTEDQRDVIVLRLLVDLSLEQTAEVLGKKIGSIKALQRRAIASLRQHFESTGVSQ